LQADTRTDGQTNGRINIVKYSNLDCINKVILYSQDLYYILKISEPSTTSVSKITNFSEKKKKKNSKFDQQQVDKGTHCVRA